ncbi:MAG: hypothetical protein P8J27_08480 [Mariniblastus sp.]|nr:hypothetical protein [Mariniblastus sp.]
MSQSSSDERVMTGIRPFAAIFLFDEATHGIQLWLMMLDIARA